MQAPAVRIRGRCDTSTNFDCNQFHLTPCCLWPPAPREEAGSRPPAVRFARPRRRSATADGLYPQGNSRNISLVFACERSVRPGAGHAHRNAVRRPGSGRCAWPDGCREDHLDDRRRTCRHPQPRRQPAPLLGDAPDRARLGTMPSRPARPGFAASCAGPFLAVEREHAAATARPALRKRLHLAGPGHRVPQRDRADAVSRRRQPGLTGPGGDAYLALPG